MERWYAASTVPKGEPIAREDLLAHEIETYLPLQVERRLIWRKVIPVCVPLIPGYIFARFDAANPVQWRSVKCARGVNRLIGVAESPTPLPAGVVEELQLREAAGEFGLKDDDAAPTFTAGQMLRIISGPLTAFEGICLMSKAERVRVLLSMFGRTSSVELRADQVQAA